MKFLESLPLFLAVLNTVEPAPTPDTLGSDLTLLIHNDILGPESAYADSGVLLLSAQSEGDAANACQAVSENLWAPEMKNSSIQSALDYLSYEGKYPANQQYWIGSTASGPRTINGRRKISTVSSQLCLPVLCTQTATFSNASFQDTSETWQVAVHSNDEDIIGFRDRVSFRFLGVRYAAQPERFTYSTPYVGSGGNESALEYGSSCVQYVYPSSTGSEDCLFLNIWTSYLPAKSKTSSDLKAVMFHIHSGGFQAGSGSDPSFDGGTLASRGDVVVVTLNYRLTTLGLLALDDGVTNGNYAIADMVTALDWVRAHIGDFGGDPKRITIMGQSAGAVAVTAMIASPRSIGKFVAAIAQSYTAGYFGSGPFTQYYPIQGELVSSTTKAVLLATNCINATSQLACLRAVPAYIFSDLYSTGTYSEVLVEDGTYLTTPELLLNKSAPGADVHLMIGTMRDDGASFDLWPLNDNLSAEINRFNTGSSYTHLAMDPSAVFASGAFPQPAGTNAILDVFNVTSRTFSDNVFRCLSAATAYAGFHNKLFKPDVYYFEFNRSYQSAGWDPNEGVCQAPVTASHPYGDPDLEYFKCHSGDLYYVLGTLQHTGLPLRDDNDLLFEQFAVDSWTSFARTYNPNPDMGFLEARGFTNSTAELNMAGMWKPISGDGLSIRRLQWPSYQTEWSEQKQCEVLGLQLDYYV